MKILIVDDSIFVRKVITKTLQASFEGVDIVACTDGEEAYNAYLEHRPDILITDLLMPNMTGQDMLRKIKTVYPDCRAIVISADIQNATREELDEIGIVGLINKPLTPDKLSLLVELIRGQNNA